MVVADPILVLFIILGSAFIAGQIFSYLRLPQVLGYLIAGFGLGVPYFSNFFTGSGPFIEFFTEIGLILLFFFVGLGMDTKNIRKMKTSASLGIWATAIPFVLGTGMALLMGQGILPALIIGIAISVSAQAITIEVLDETNLLEKKFGKDVVGAGVLADILQLVGISIIFGLLTTVTQTSLFGLLLGWLGFFAAIVMLKVAVIPLMLKFIPDEKTNTITFFTGALIIALFMGFLGDILGVGSILGALFAGILVKQVSDQRIVRKLTKELKVVSFGFFIPVFFLWLGFNVGITGLIENIELGLLLAGLSIIGTLTGAVIAYNNIGKDWREGITAGWALQAKGDFDIIIAAVAIEVGAITSGIFGGLIIMSALSMLISPAMFYLSVKWMKDRGVKLG